MTFGVAYVVSSGASTGQLLTADRFARWNRIQTAFTFSLDDGLLSARTGRDQSWRESAISAGTLVTGLGAVVILAVQLGTANFLAAEPSLVQVRDRTSHLLLLLATVTFVFQRFLAFLTVAHVALLLACVNFAVERFRAGRFARDVVLLTALHRLRHPATAATALYHRLARRTRSRMTEQRTRVLAQFLPATQFSTRMRHIAPVVLRILLLAAKAEILPRDLFGHVLTGRATPTIVRL